MKCLEIARFDDCLKIHSGRYVIRGAGTTLGKERVFNVIFNAPFNVEYDVRVMYGRDSHRRIWD